MSKKNTGRGRSLGGEASAIVGLPILYPSCVGQSEEMSAAGGRARDEGWDPL